nr:putative reverse transcriptase domain-containing protein [Tanacetum cinerariifolium]
MSSDNAQYAVTYTSISSDSDGPSWGIPLINVDEFSEIDPYEEIAQQGQVEDDDEDPEEYLSEEHELEDDNEDPEEDPNEEHELEDSNEIEPLEEDETVITPPPPRHHGVRISVRPQTPMAASTHALIDAIVAGSSPFPLPPTSPAYDQAQLGRRAAMIRMRDDILKEDMPPRRRFVLTAPPPGCDVAESYAAARAPRSQYNFVDTIEAGHGLVRSPGHDARTISRAADRAEDISYVRALQASKQRMMTSIEEVNLRTDLRDIKLEIDVVRGQMTAYKTELQERQSVEDFVVTQMMRIHTLEARARTDTVEDNHACNKTRNKRCHDSRIHSSYDRLGNPKKLYPYPGRCKPKFRWRTQKAYAICAALTWWNGHVRTLGHEAAYAMTWGTLKKKMTDKYCPKGEIKKLEIELWNLRVKGNDNENKRKTDNNQQQQPHQKHNVARAYTADPGEKKVYTGDLPLFTKCNYHHMGQCPPKCGKCKRYGHTTTDYLANTNNNNNNKNQKAGACYECGNTGHIKRNCQKLNNRGNAIAQGRAYVFGGRDASPDSNVITGTFLLNNRYTKILFDTGADRSFVSTTFSALIGITPTTLENHYDVELANRKIIGVNTIVRGWTFNFMNHPFNIDLMPVPLDSFDVIIRMDWLTNYHGVIICDEKIVRVPFGREMLIFQGNRDNQREESRLNVISCTKSQEYLSKGCDVFLACITRKEAKDKSEGKQLEDVPIVKYFPEIFPEDLSGIPLARQVEFQIDLVPGATPVAQAPYRLAPSKMKELAGQLQELSDKGFIRPSSSPWGFGLVRQKERRIFSHVHRLP